MATALVRQENEELKINRADEDALFAAVAEGDLAKLTQPQRLAYYTRRCKELGLNPLNQPFSWLTLNGKLTLYANRSCSEELRETRKISVHIVAREIHGDCYVVTARATTPEGRADESTGAVPLPDGLRGDAKANALMKAETKAKRRVTLSICGLGFLDETEVVTIPEVQKRLEKAAQEEYEQEHAAIIAKVEEASQVPVIEPENESQEPPPNLIDENQRKKLFAVCKDKGVPKEDLRRYVLEWHKIDSISKITVEMLADIHKWLEGIAQ